MLVTLLQGFASGLPLSIIGSALQTWFAVSGVDVIAIGSLTLVGQPYVYKFLWSPFLDRFILPFLGKRRGWIMLTQIGLVLGIIWLSFLNPIDNAIFIGALALIISFLSASQDIAIDAYRTDLLDAKERGIGVALYAAGYRVAMLVSGGIALILADQLGWQIMFFIMAFLLICEILVTWLVAKEPPSTNHPVNLQQAFIEPIKNFLQRNGAIAILIFIVLYKLTDVFALSLGSKFLIDIGFSLTTIGTVYKGVGLASTLLGTFCGGLLMLRISHYAALLWFGILQALSNLTFAWLALAGKSTLVLMFAVFAENFCGGLATIALLAFLMSLCDKRYTATQYAILSSLMAIGRVYFGPVAGVIAHTLHVETNHANWALFFIGSFLAAIPSLALLFYLRKKIFQDEVKEWAP